MVDFKKRLTGKKAESPTDPIKLYDTLDRAHDKGPLRPAQEAILSEWFAKRKLSRDVIVKLHTGQGKTLVGLLMLQSRLNAGKGPVVYLCPDHFLIAQTCEQAKQFGIRTCTAEDNLPDDFINSKTILVTSVQKLFNGLTKFGLNRQYIEVDTVLMDDAHTCAERIREACRIRIASTEPAYHEIRTLFSSDLESQGIGTYADIRNDKRDAILPIPYWCWIDREGDVARILSAYSDRKSVKFSWPLLKDMIANCQCVISGTALEIEPSVPPLWAFGSYHYAAHRIFMSATVTDDAFLIKGLQLEADTIINPLTYVKETWSGEKMILLPSVIHDALEREALVKLFGTPNEKRKYGVAVLAPSFNRTKDWEAYGSIIARNDTVWEVVDS
jgi:replicative superfamily II helicase